MKELTSTQEKDRNNYLFEVFKNHIVGGNYIYFEYGSKKEFIILVKAFGRIGFRILGVRDLNEGTINHVFKWNMIEGNYKHKAFLYFSRNGILRGKDYIDWTCTDFNYSRYYSKKPIHLKETLKILKEIDKNIKSNIYI